MLFVCDSHSQRMVYIHLYVSVQTFLFALKTNQLGDEQKDCNETDNHRFKCEQKCMHSSIKYM